ncbi:staygreen family protein [Evansella clarkii]|jgi:hypothetical protein|uniref:staygreen family protein n=1 Tax=Evansella clarkii TaxID=79879 RepID=UPI000998539D|nr:staygreen family protein [Evansella clarkii]
MGKLDPAKLFREYRDGAGYSSPVSGRRHTLTHSDITGELFLTTGHQFAYDKVDLKMRDEVLGEWLQNDRGYIYCVYLHVDERQFTLEEASIRNQVFIRELPLALEAVRYGDSNFFSSYPQLDYAPVIVHFKSSYRKLNRRENWGSFADFKSRAR